MSDEVNTCKGQDLASMHVAVPALPNPDALVRIPTTSSIRQQRSNANHIIGHIKTDR